MIYGLWFRPTESVWIWSLDFVLVRVSTPAVNTMTESQGLEEGVYLAYMSISQFIIKGNPDRNSQAET